MILNYLIKEKLYLIILRFTNGSIVIYYPRTNVKTLKTVTSTFFKDCFLTIDK
jgi:hypothetical protein